MSSIYKVVCLFPFRLRERWTDRQIFFKNLTPIFFPLFFLAILLPFFFLLSLFTAIVGHYLCTIALPTFLKPSHLQDWKEVQALVGKTGKESLKRRCLELDASTLQDTIARRAQKLLGKLELDEVRDISAGAATFFVWVSLLSSSGLNLTAKKVGRKVTFVPCIIQNWLNSDLHL